MTDEMKQKIADMAYNEAERLRYMNVRGLMEIAYGLASLSANWYRNNVWHDVNPPLFIVQNGESLSPP